MSGGGGGGGGGGRAIYPRIGCPGDNVSSDRLSCGTEKGGTLYTATPGLCTYGHAGTVCMSCVLIYINFMTCDHAVVQKKKAQRPSSSRSKALTLQCS